MLNNQLLFNLKALDFCFQGVSEFTEKSEEFLTGCLAEFVNLKDKAPIFSFVNSISDYAIKENLELWYFGKMQFSRSECLLKADEENDKILAYVQIHSPKNGTVAVVDPCLSPVYIFDFEVLSYE